MISRLDVKIVVTLILSTLIPMGLSIHLASIAVRTALGVGLNKDVAAALERSQTASRRLIEIEKQSQKNFLKRLSESTPLNLSCTSGDFKSLSSYLRSTAKDEPGVLRLTVNRKGQRPLEVRGMTVSGPYREVHRQAPLHTGQCVALEVVFGVDKRLTDDLKQAAIAQQTFSALYKAPRSYLTRRVVVVYGILLLLAVGVSVLVGVWLARRMARRIHTLSLATAQVASGDLSVRIPSGGNDEVGQLVVAFNQMVNDLARTRAKVEYLQKINTWQDIARRLAHEIKNPLTPIHLAAQQLKSKYREQQPGFEHLLEQSVDIIEEEVATLKRLVTDFSAFAKMPDVSLQETDLTIFLAECKSALNYIGAQHEINLLWQLPTQPVFALIDHQMLKRVIDNLIRNAAEALTEHQVEKPEIRIFMKTDKGPDGQKVAIVVTDNGPGIQAEHHRSLFEPYFTTKATGTGLGLAISKKIVLEHNGKIRVDDSKQAGASFIVELPLCR